MNINLIEKHGKQADRIEMLRSHILAEYDPCSRNAERLIQYYMRRDAYLASRGDHGVPAMLQEQAA